MLEFLYRIRPTRVEMLDDGGTEEERAAVGAHFAYLQQLLAEGRLILAGRTQSTGPESFGIVIFRATDGEEAASMVAADPAVAGGVMQAQLFPYHVALRGE